MRISESLWFWRVAFFAMAAIAYWAMLNPQVITKTEVREKPIIFIYSSPTHDNPSIITEVI